MNAEPRVPLGRSLLHQLPMLVWLVVLWMLLWGSFSWLNLVTGILIALLITRVFYLPPVELSGRINLWWSVVFVGHFLFDVAKASVQVSWLAINPRKVPKSSVVAVQLHTRSDLIMTLISISISLVPGSLVVEADRINSVLYVHVLDTSTRGDVEHGRHVVLAVERRIVRALGSKEDLRRIEEGRELK